MPSRFAIPVVALSLFACQMDNPGFAGTDEVADASEGSSTRGGGTEAGESTSADTSTDTGTEVDSSSSATTSEACTPGDPCGTCHECNMLGECLPTPGAACDGEGIQCSDYVFGFGEGVCYGFAETSLAASCSQAGQCLAPSPSLCPQSKGEALLACDPVCVQDPQVCSPLTLISDIDFSTLCVNDGSETPGCQAHCSPFDEIVKNGCVDGVCEAVLVEGCEPYSCNPLTAECFIGCELVDECALGFLCNLDTNMCEG